MGIVKTVVTNRLQRFLAAGCGRSEIRTAETHKRYHYNSSHVQSQSFATQQWGPAVNQVQSSQRSVKSNQRSVPNQRSNIRSFSGPSFSAHAKLDRPRHPKPRVLASRARLNEREAPGKVATARSPKRSAQLHSVCFTCSRFNFVEAPVKNVKTDTIWQPTLQRQLGDHSYLVNLFKRDVVS